jgi:hypothetical protein
MEGLKTATAERKRDASLLIQQVMNQPGRQNVVLSHTAPSSFKPGQAIELSFARGDKNQPLTAGRLHYRHVNQAERWNVLELQMDAGRLYGWIPANYTSTEYAMQYFVELHNASTAWLYPGLDIVRGTQPYFVVPQTS